MAAFYTQKEDKLREKQVVQPRQRQKVLHVEHLEVLSELNPPTDRIEFAYESKIEFFFLIHVCHIKDTSPNHILRKFGIELFN